mmetsp:Transcript_5988/g.15437  ORF Transcript_5988/g.15437 Transcript_5988/m.15437 type:complete len:255 (-) Transcript_5988:1276-2040(-)
MSRAAASYWRPQADRAHVPTWSSHQLLLSPKGWRPALRSIRHHDRARTHAVCRIVRGVPHCRRLHLRLSLLRLSGGCFRGCGTLQKASVPQHRERCGRKSLSRLSLPDLPPLAHRQDHRFAVAIDSAAKVGDDVDHRPQRICNLEDELLPVSAGAGRRSSGVGYWSCRARGLCGKGCGTAQQGQPPLNGSAQDAAQLLQCGERRTQQCGREASPLRQEHQWLRDKLCQTGPERLQHFAKLGYCDEESTKYILEH